MATCFAISRDLVGWPRTWVSTLDMAFLPCGGCRGRSGLRRRGVVEAVEFRSVGRRALHLPPDPHIERKRNRHDHRSTDSQYEKPPQHPHSTFRIADRRQRKCAQNEEERATAVSPSSLTWPALCGESQRSSRRVPDACGRSSTR